MSRKASALVDSDAECEVLLELVEMALIDLKPPTMVQEVIRRLSISSPLEGNVTSRQSHDNNSLLKSYERVHEHLLSLSESFSVKEKHINKLPGAFSCCIWKSKVETNSRPALSWKASFTKERQESWYSCCTRNNSVNSGEYE